MAVMGVALAAGLAAYASAKTQVPTSRAENGPETAKSADRFAPATNKTHVQLVKPDAGRTVQIELGRNQPVTLDVSKLAKGSYRVAFDHDVNRLVFLFDDGSRIELRFVLSEERRVRDDISVVTAQNAKVSFATFLMTAPRPPTSSPPSPPPPPPPTSSSYPGFSSMPPEFPQFPWPPPAPSASYVLPANLLTRRATIGDAVDAIVAALEYSGYLERSFFQTEAGGVALVSRLESIDDDGLSLKGPNRWPAKRMGNDLAQFFSRLFFIDPGRYRVIVFILQDAPFPQSSKSVTEGDARAWLRDGANVLPQGIASRSFANGHCTVLIYEFASEGRIAKVVPSRFTAKEHLEKAGVWSLLSAK